MKKLIPLTIVGVLAFTNAAFAHSSYVPKSKVKHTTTYSSSNQQQDDQSSVTPVTQQASVQPNATVPVQQTVAHNSAMAPVQQAASQPSVSASSANGVVQTAESIAGRGHYAHTYDPAHLTFDCSGFTYYVFQKNGIDLHSKSPAGQMSQGVYVPKSQLQPGDLVFFGSGSHVQHVAIYVGNGQVVDAANSQRGVTYSNLSWSWYTNSYLTARRVL